MKLKITTLVGCLFLYAFSYGQQKVEKNFTGIDNINMSTSSGDCIVKKSDGNKVYVLLEHNFDTNRYEPVIEQSGSTLKIKEVFSRGSSSGFAKWTLMVPDNVEIKFNTGSGNFSASNLKVSLNLNTGSGNYAFDRIIGDIVSNSGSGNMSISSFEGEMKSNTGSGNIRVSGAKGELKLNCGSGNIDITNTNAGIKANVGSGNISGSGMLIASSSSFNSGSGDVELTLSASPKADLSVNSGSGDAELDYDGNEIEGLITMKANKKNGDIEAPFDFDSTEEINENGNQTVIKKTAKIGNSNLKINVSTGSGTASISK